MKRMLLSGWHVLIIMTVATLAGGITAQAAEYKIDPDHSFVEFRIQHLGFSWLYGRFNTVSGDFSHDPVQPKSNRIAVTIDTGSVDTRHAERDKHLRSKDFLDVKKYPTATFKSTGYSGSTEEGNMEGALTLHGVTRPITIKVKKVGEGKDPWKGYRAGFIGTMTLKRSDFGISYNLGPASETMEMELSIEGIRK
ncbi:MAG: YceI family protein [Thermodesulfobacteriota bacterium]